MKWIAAEPGLHLGFEPGSMDPAAQIKKIGRKWAVYRGWHFVGIQAHTLASAKMEAEG